MNLFVLQKVYLKHSRTHSNQCYLCGVPVRGARHYLTHLMVHVEKIKAYPEESQWSFENPPPLLKINCKTQEIQCRYCGVRYCY